jgi:Fe-S cluster assembly ATP-binding protein
MAAHPDATLGPSLYPSERLEQDQASLRRATVNYALKGNKRAPDMPDALLDIHDLTLRREGRCILDGITLAIQTGEIHALVGGNGCGKSSLAKAIMGCEGYRPDSGEISFDGQRINDSPLHERARLGITLAWQEPARIEGVGVQEFLTLKHPDADPDVLLRKVGLAPGRYLDRMLDKTLSGGERKRIELAAVVGMRPRLALLDEPAAGVDLRSVDEIVHVVQELKTSGSTVLLISHRQEMARIADSASQMCGGRLIYSGEPGAVADHYRQHHCVYCDGELCTDEQRRA